MIDDIIAIAKRTNLKIAFQKNGRLTEQSRNVFTEKGVLIDVADKEVMPAPASNMTFFGLRDDDIPQYVESGAIQFGIIGSNVLAEKYADNDNIIILEELPEKDGLVENECRLSLAFPKGETIRSKQDMANKTYATSYPVLLQQYFDENEIDANIRVVTGATELAVSLGMADALCDLVVTGSTLKKFGLIEKEVIGRFRPVLIANRAFWEKEQSAQGTVIPFQQQLACAAI